MKHWNLKEIDAPSGSRSPVVLHSDSEARAVLIALDAGQALGEHEVKEHSFVHVIDGTVTVEAAGETLEAPAGTLVRFTREERRSVRSDGGARILLLLAPWPGEGHYRGEELAARG